MGVFSMLWSNWGRGWGFWIGWRTRARSDGRGHSKLRARVGLGINHAFPNGNTPLKKPFHLGKNQKKKRKRKRREKRKR